MTQMKPVSDEVKEKVKAQIEKASKRGATRAVASFTQDDVQNITTAAVDLKDGRSILLIYLNQPELKILNDLIEGKGRTSDTAERKEKNEDEYQGWPNRETWAMVLYIDNDQGLQEQTFERIRETIRNINNDENIKNKIWTRNEAIKFRTEEHLKDWMEELRLEALEHPGEPQKEVLKMFDDIGSFWRIEWTDVAEHYLHDIIQEDEFRKMGIKIK